VKALRDPGVRAGLVLVAVVIAGFVMIPLAWRGVARAQFVPLQVPWLLSAGVAGLALIGGALGALTIHIGRRADAQHRAAMDDVIRTAIELADGVGKRR
jgi:uncharacterized membrane protein